MGKIGESFLILPSSKTYPVKINLFEHLLDTKFCPIFCFDSDIDWVKITRILWLIGRWKWVSWLEVGCREGDCWRKNKYKTKNLDSKKHYLYLERIYPGLFYFLGCYQKVKNCQIFENVELDFDLCIISRLYVQFKNSQ